MDLRVVGVAHGGVLVGQRQARDRGPLHPLHELDERGQLALGDVGLDVVLGDGGEGGVLLQHDDGVHLADQGTHHAPLTAHPAEVVGGRPRAGEPQGPVAAEVLTPGVDPAGDAADRAAGAHVAADRDALLDVDVDPSHGIDQRAEAVEVDDRGVVDAQPEHGRERVPGGGQPGVGVAGKEVPVLLSQGPDGVHQALGPAVVALGVELVQRVVVGERDVLQVAGHTDQERVAGPGVDARHHHRVGAHAGAVGAGVGAEQQDVDAGRAGPRVGLGAAGAGVGDSGGAGCGMPSGAEQAADHVALDGDVAHGLRGGRQHHQAHQDRERAGGHVLGPGQVAGPGAARRPDDGGAPDEGPDDNRDTGDGPGRSAAPRRRGRCASPRAAPRRRPAPRRPRRTAP